MQQLAVSLAPNLHSTSDPELVSAYLDQLPKIPINYAPWPAFNYKPTVSFSLSYSYSCIFLKYFVTEHEAKAFYQHSNDPVFEDSCVEFFWAFANDKNYYNLEFNLLGTCRLGFGSEKNHRELLPESVINCIKRKPVIKAPTSTHPELTTWELTLIIPAETFTHHNYLNFKGIKGKANFFKCGDKLSRPHFISWQNIQSATPNFHLPEFFGEVYFV